MPISIAVVAVEPATRERLAGLLATHEATIFPCSPDALPESMPSLFVIALPGLETPEEQLIERLRANPNTERLPIVIASALPMVQLQSVPYASDWTIAIVEEPVAAEVLAETIKFLLNPEG